jgi:hypothetical protein
MSTRCRSHVFTVGRIEPGDIPFSVSSSSFFFSFIFGEGEGERDELFFKPFKALVVVFYQI